MRLTLRTLLAYRDGVLSPADSEEMHRRIQQSEDASKLLKRIDSIASQIQTASSRIVDKGLGGDPNSLAEYLDDVLQSKQVPELERICLESDEYLAELAACHSLLASALNTRVRVPESLRELAKSVESEEGREALRSHLAERKQSRGTDNGKARHVKAALVRPDDPHSESGAVNSSASADLTDSDSDPSAGNVGGEHVESVQVHAPMLASGGESIKQQGLDLESGKLTHEVPEYLQGNRGASWTIPLGILGLLLLFAFLLWQSLGPIDRVRELFVANPENRSADASPSDNESHRNQERNRDSSANLGASSEATNASESAVAGSAALSTQNTENAADSASNAISEKVGGEKSEGAIPAQSNNAMPSELDREGDLQSAVDSPANVSDNGASLDTKLQTDDGTGTVGDDSANTADAPDGLTWMEKAAESNSVLLSRSDNESWQRLNRGTQLADGSQIVVPPFSVVSLASPGNASWQVSGPTIGKFEDVHSVELKLGRLMLSATSDNQTAEIRSPVAGSVQIDLADNESVVAVEQTYRASKHGPATDPVSFPSVLVIAVVDGSAVAKQENGTEIALGLGEALAIVADEKPVKFPMKSIPDWYRMRPIRPIDLEAAEEFSADLQLNPTDANASIESVLQRLTQHWRPEEAALAVQTSLLMGDVKPLFEQEFFEDDQLQIHWAETIALTRKVLAAKPTLASELEAQMRNALSDGDLAFQVLIGLPQDQLNPAGMEKLIDLLRSKEMATRVLAFDRLYLTTGLKLGYRPDVADNASVLNWRRELSKKRIPMLSPRDPIWERQRSNP